MVKIYLHMTLVHVYSQGGIAYKHLFKPFSFPILYQLSDCCFSFRTAVAQPHVIHFQNKSIDLQ